MLHGQHPKARGHMNSPYFLCLNFDLFWAFSHLKESKYSQKQLNSVHLSKNECLNEPLSDLKTVNHWKQLLLLAVSLCGYNKRLTAAEQWIRDQTERKMKPLFPFTSSRWRYGISVWVLHRDINSLHELKCMRPQNWFLHQANNK